MQSHQTSSCNYTRPAVAIIFFNKISQSYSVLAITSEQLSSCIHTTPAVAITTHQQLQSFCLYLLGEKHPAGTRLTDYQKCVRTNDIDEVGDNRHLTYFEMLGNWSLGDYFKEESIQMSFEFLTKELGIPVEKLSVTCFAGDEDCSRDEISASCWEKAGIAKDHIYFYGKDDNW